MPGNRSRLRAPRRDRAGLHPSGRQRSTKGSARRSGERRHTSRSRASRGRRLSPSRVPTASGSRRSRRRTVRFGSACARGFAKAGHPVFCRSPRSAARPIRTSFCWCTATTIRGTSASATTRPVMRRCSSSRAFCTPFATASSGRSESRGGPDIRPAVTPARHGSPTHSPTRSTSGASRHLNIDSPGCAGATAYEEVMWMAEAAELCIDAIGDAVDEPARRACGRCARATIRSTRSAPARCSCCCRTFRRPSVRRAAITPSAGVADSPVWHTPAGRAGRRGRRDSHGAICKVYLTAILRVLNAPLHPFDYERDVTEIASAVGKYQEHAGSEVDLTPVLNDLRRWERRLAPGRSEAERRLAAEPRR